MTIFAQIEDATRRVVCEVDEEEQPAPHDGFSYRLLDAPINWSAPSPTGAPYWFDDEPAPRWLDPSLTDAQAAAWGIVKSARTVAELAPFEYDGQLYDADVTRVAGAALNALMAQLAGVPFSIDWTLADNTVRTLNGAQMQACGLALAQHIETAFGTARAMREAIAAATTPAAAYEAAAWPAPTEEPNV